MRDEANIGRRQRNHLIGVRFARSAIILTFGAVIPDDTNALDAPAIGIEYLELETWHGPNHLALGRNTAA